MNVRIFVYAIAIYSHRMKNDVLEKIRDRSVVAAVTHDHARVWLLNDESRDPVCEVTRATPIVRHVRAAQDHHGHASEVAEVPYFTELAAILSVASNVVLVGHGVGKSNAVNRFINHLDVHREALRNRIAATGTANITAMSGGQIIEEARRKWAQADH